jgi:hypothetical protein
MNRFFCTRRDALGVLVSCAAVGGGWAADASPRTYPTQMPPTTTLKFRLKRGAWSGTGELVWQPSGERYQARLQGTVMGMRVLKWASEGALDPASGIAPQQFTDERRGKEPKVARFDRSASQVTYSESAEVFPLASGTQDRLSWMIQLAAIANAEPRRVAPGGHTAFWVSGARSDLDVWSFESKGSETVSTSVGDITAIKLLREPRKPNDTKVEVWLDPTRHHLPIRARMGNAQGGDALELVLQALA